MRYLSFIPFICTALQLSCFNAASAYEEKLTSLRFIASSPEHFHRVSAVAPSSDYIEIEDGSHWRINPSEGYKLAHWKFNDKVIITANRAPFSRFNYLLSNQTNGYSVSANIHVGSSGKSAHSLKAVNYQKRQLVLENGAIFDIAYTDMSQFLDWKVGDSVVLATNDCIWSAHEYILINANMNRHVRVNLSH